MSGRPQERHPIESESRGVYGCRPFSRSHSPSRCASRRPNTRVSSAPTESRALITYITGMGLCLFKVDRRVSLPFQDSLYPMIPIRTPHSDNIASVPPEHPKTPLYPILTPTVPKPSRLPVPRFLEDKISLPDPSSPVRANSPISPRACRAGGKGPLPLSLHQPPN